MSLVVQLKSFADPSKAVDVSLELPSKPTDAMPSDAEHSNSTWQVKDYGYLAYWKGECMAVTLGPFDKEKNTLLLVHYDPSSVRPNGRVVRGAMIAGVSLFGFFGFDGGIRAKGRGVVGTKLALSLNGDIEWAIAPSQKYVASREDDPFMVLERLKHILQFEVPR